MKRKSPQTNPEDNPEQPLEAAAEEVMAATESESPTQVFESAEATAMQAVEAVSEAAEEAVEAVQSAGAALLPAVREYFGKVFYGAFYYTSYGVVYSALTVARLVPMDNAMGRAINDGALAARNAVENKAEPAATEPAIDEAAVLNA